MTEPSTASAAAPGAEASDPGAAGGEPGGRWRHLLRDRPSAGSLLLGPEAAVAVFRRVTGWYATAVGAMAVLASALLLRSPVDGVAAGPALVVGLVALAAGGAVLAAGDRTSEAMLQGLSLVAVVGMVVEVGLLGPHFEMAVVVPALAIVQALLYLSRRTTLLAAGLVLVSYAGLVLGVAGYPAPAVRLLVVVVSVTATAWVLVWIIGQIEALALRARHTRAELAAATEALTEANAALEERLGRQGEELGSLQELRRFVAPQVVDTLLQDGIEALAPHRQRIAVVEFHLRHFTAFLSVAEPEEVTEVLEEHYAVVGQALLDRQATVGSLVGDRIMAYLGDPIPRAEPAAEAVALALELTTRMREVVAGWRRRGFDVGFATGVAYGFATIGPFGFDGRMEYTALGPTVHLASRLAGAAQDGEVLIDGRAHAAVESMVTSVDHPLELAGFRSVVHAHRVTGWVGPTPGAAAPSPPSASRPTGAQTSGQG